MLQDDPSFDNPNDYGGGGDNNGNEYNDNSKGGGCDELQNNLQDLETTVNVLQDITRKVQPALQSAINATATTRPKTARRNILHPSLQAGSQYNKSNLSKLMDTLGKFEKKSSSPTRLRQSSSLIMSNRRRNLKKISGKVYTCPIQRALERYWMRKGKGKSKKL